MPERPLLNLPEPVEFVPRPGPRGGSNIAKPTRDRQSARLAPRFERLMRVADDPEELLSFRDDPGSIAPERAIVFEVAGSLKNFYIQARDIGFEYLGDFEDEIEPSDDFFDQKNPEKEIAGRIYLAMPDVHALRELLSLWRRYTGGRVMPKGKGPWRELFSMLVDVRPWGPQDRIPPETLKYWQKELAQSPERPIRFEIELWYHEDENRRTQASERLQHEIRVLGGVIIHQAVIPEIRYDAVLVDVPAEHVQTIIDHPGVALARVDEIMFLRPQTIARYPAKEDREGEKGPPPSEMPIYAAPEPIAALLDGLPVQNHARLRGRLIIDDPDNLEPRYPVALRRHGTEMASLIVHGDLTRGEAPLSRPLFVTPIMQSTEHGDERTPPDRLFVDVIYRTVRRIMVGEGGEPPSAPGVIIINLSLGDEWRPFTRTMSPLGRLLDYLANRYRILFMVSAGNIMDRLTLPDFPTSVEFEAATPEARESAILAALNAKKAERSLLSPAEALNILTVGAAHCGAAFNGRMPRNLFDPFTDEELPNIASAMGLGFRKIVKPELLFEGGRAPVLVVASGGGVSIAPARGPARLFGAKAAAAEPLGDIRYEDFTWGTSVATALATRAGHLVHDVLMAAGNGSNHADIPPEYRALMLKVLLVHGANWGPKGEFLDGFFQPQGLGSHFQRRDDITRLLGYGVCKIERVVDCTVNRATLLGVGTIAPESASLYSIPLPPDLDGVRAFRALTVTLAWFSPVNPRHQGYRMAALDVSAASDEKYWPVQDRFSTQPTDKATARGTIFHERRYGEAATVFVDNGHLLLRISCRAGAGDLTESVPYAMAVSFEVAVESGIQVYDQVRARLVAPIRAGVRTAP